MDPGDTFFISDLDLLFQDENAVIDYLIDNFEDAYDEDGDIDEIEDIIKESGE